PVLGILRQSFQQIAGLSARSVIDRRLQLNGDNAARVPCIGLPRFYFPRFIKLYQTRIAQSGGHMYLFIRCYKSVVGDDADYCAPIADLLSRRTNFSHQQIDLLKHGKSLTAIRSGYMLLGIQSAEITGEKLRSLLLQYIDAEERALLIGLERVIIAFRIRT